MCLIVFIFLGGKYELPRKLGNQTLPEDGKVHIFQVFLGKLCQSHTPLHNLFSVLVIGGKFLVLNYCPIKLETSTII